MTTAAYYPFVYLPVAAILRDLDAAPEEDARALGASPLQAWRRTVLPRLRPAVSGGGLLVGLHLLAEFGVLEMMRYPTFTTAILVQYEVSFSSNQGSVLALVLALMCVTVLTLEHLLRGTACTSRVGRGVHRRAARVRLGRWSPAALLALTVVVTVSLVLPVTLVCRWLLAHLAAPVDELGLRPSLLVTTGSTISLALAAAAVTTVLALPGAWLLSRRRTAWTLVLERVTYIASSLPGVVIALALITVSVRYVPGIYQSPLLLVLCYSILFIPRAMVSLRSGLAAAPPSSAMPRGRSGAVRSGPSAGSCCRSSSPRRSPERPSWPSRPPRSSPRRCCCRRPGPPPWPPPSGPRATSSTTRARLPSPP